MTPGNTREPQGYRECHRKYTAWRQVRVKWWGKSPPRDWQQYRQGKPRQEQNQAAGGLFAHAPVGRLLEHLGDWMSR